jgi:hypothetical protein
MVVHTFNPSTQESEAGGSTWAIFWYPVSKKKNLCFILHITGSCYKVFKQESGAISGVTLTYTHEFFHISPFREPHFSPLESGMDSLPVNRLKWKSQSTSDSRLRNMWWLRSHLPSLWLSHSRTKPAAISWRAVKQPKVRNWGLWLTDSEEFRHPANNQISELGSRFSSPIQSLWTIAGSAKHLYFNFHEWTLIQNCQVAHSRIFGPQNSKTIQDLLI